MKIKMLDDYRDAYYRLENGEDYEVDVIENGQIVTSEMAFQFIYELKAVITE